MTPAAGVQPQPEHDPFQVYIGLGSNLGDRLGNLRRALDMMQAEGIKVTRVSSAYDTEPVGPPQPRYLNAVCRAETRLSPRGLLAALKAIETRMGRTPQERWGPREIDLDILLYGERTIDWDELRIPHPEMLNRAFVIVPLLEIAPDLILPSGEPLSRFAPDAAEGVCRADGSLWGGYRRR